MATKRSCCIRFSCFSSASSDEKGQDPASASARSSPSAIDITIETLPGPQAPIPGSSNVDVNLNVSGTHQRGKAPLSESLNILRKYEDEDVNVNLIVSGATQCDEAPSSSSSFSRVATKSDVLNTIIEKVDVNLDDLMNHISELLKLRKEEMLHNKRLSSPSNFPWPDFPSFKKLNAILSPETDLKTLNEFLSSGLEFASELKDIISGPVRTLLNDMGRANVATAGLLVIAYSLERFQDHSANKEKCWDLIKEMSYFATIVKRLTESPGGTQDDLDLILLSITLIVEGAILCCTQIDRSAWKSFLLTSKTKDDLIDLIRRKLDVMYRKINIEIGFRLLTAIETYHRPPVGIEKPIEQVFRHLEIQSDDQDAVTVILHGFGGMGKTTLADAVFSEIGGRGMVKTTLEDADFWKARGGKCSKVRLFDGINSTPDITALQKQILEDLMEPGETIPEIRTHKDGQRALEGVLRKINAFIYIDNVLKADALEELLPQNMTTAKNVRLLLTARNIKDVEKACPKSSTKPKIYEMQEILREDAMTILKREIEEGVTETQFSEIIQICGGIPLMLTLAAAFIRRADNKEEAYATLMEQKDKWASEDFKEMRYAFAYDALPQPCKDPFLDVCTYFNGWNWDIVKDIVGDDALMMLKSRALVTRTTNGFASVHDVILTLAHGMSKEESEDKEVRRKFTNASELKMFLEKGDTEGIRGIWLTERKDVPKEEEDDDDRKEVVVQASALDKFHNSLRVLQLGNSIKGEGNWIKVEGNCEKIFKELVFFKAKISQLPFDDVSQLPQLRYLSYDPPNWVPSSLPPRLAIMNFNAKTFQRIND